MLLADLVAASQAVRAARKRTDKVAAMAAALAAAERDEVAAVATLLAGEPTHRPLSVGPATLWAAAAPPAAEPSLTVADVDAAFARLAAARGPGSATARTEVVSGLLARATGDEQQLVAGLILGELRQGALTGLAAQAIARAFDVDGDRVRRALMLRADLGAVAAAATGGSAALEAFRLEIGRPVQPMLAVTAAEVGSALGDFAAAVVEAKLDGARVQVHRQGETVRVYTRSLREVTGQLPEVTRLAASLPATSLVLDGEVLGLGPDGRPEPFQQTMRCFGAEADLDRGGRPEGVDVTPFFFDVLHVDGRELLDEPLRTRREALAGVVPEAHRVGGEVVACASDAEAVAERALAAGHEGVMVKDLGAPYAAGRRGSAWRKVKPAHTLDLVVLVAEWGHGRRRGWLSNLHLGAIDETSGEPLMLGKTFKGLTDELLEWQTRRFLELERAREGHVVQLEPVQIVEVAVDGVQTSPRYPAGLALRFAGAALPPRQTRRRGRHRGHGARAARGPAPLGDVSGATAQRGSSGRPAPDPPEPPGACPAWSGPSAQPPIAWQRAVSAPATSSAPNRGASSGYCGALVELRSISTAWAPDSDGSVSRSWATAALTTGVAIEVPDATRTEPSGHSVSTREPGAATSIGPRRAANSDSSPSESIEVTDNVSG